MEKSISQTPHPLGFNNNIYHEDTISRFIKEKLTELIEQTFKETRSVTMKIVRKKYFLFKSFVKIELWYVFTINMFSTAEKLKNTRKSELSYYNRCFSVIGNYLRPSKNSRQLIFNTNAVVLIVVIC